MKADAFLTNALLPDGRKAHIGISRGLISGIGPVDRAVENPVAATMDVGGALVLPGFIDGHTHLDKTLIGLPWRPHGGDGTRMSRIENDKKAWPELPPTVDRASNLVDLCIRQGTAHIRSHADVDLEAGLSKVEALIEVRERFRGQVGLTIVAFPQSGVMRCPGVLDLLDQAVAAGADLVGGIDPSEIDRDPRGQLDGIFAIAERRGVGVDIHLHEPGEMGLLSVRQICERTSALGLAGRVTISHGFCLGMVAERKADEAIAWMARCGVNLVTHGGASATSPPLLKLRRAGITAFAGNDDIRDTWSPYGSADMLERASLIGWRSDFRRDEELHAAFDMVTAAGARAHGIANYGMVVGAPADLCAVEASCVPEAIVSHPPRRWVMKAGCLVARDGRRLAGPQPLDVHAPSTAGKNV
jgi:cytosine/adenosine deaminase-related metal-dependent hydrolase